MGLSSWVKGWFSSRNRALGLYRRGMTKASKRDYSGAIADYSAAIESPHIPADVRAMTLYNRSLAYSAIHEDAKSDEDLAAVLQIPGLPENIKTQALQRQGRIRRRHEHPDG